MAQNKYQYNEASVAVHLDPVWRDRADFLIHAKLERAETPAIWEQLWARQIADNRFEICCIPFFAKDLALGDVVETGLSDDAKYVVQKVIEASGHYTFRVWFVPSTGSLDRQALLNSIERLGGLLEWSSDDFVATDVGPDMAQLVADILWRSEQRGELLYDTGKSS